MLAPDPALDEGQLGGFRCGGVRRAVARRHHDEQAVGLTHGEDLLDLAHELQGRYGGDIGEM